MIDSQSKAACRGGMTASSYETRGVSAHGRKSWLIPNNLPLSMIPMSTKSIKLASESSKREGKSSDVRSRHVTEE